MNKDALGKRVEKNVLYRCIMSGAASTTRGDESFNVGMRLLGSSTLLQSSAAAFFVRDDTPDDQVPDLWSRPTPNPELGRTPAAYMPGGHGI